MEPPHLNRTVSRDRGISDSFTMRSRAGSEVDPTTIRPSTRETDENCSPATLPRAFESMLKTTTETGDIGIFSIKPSRVPQSTGTPRRLLTGNNENGLHKSRQTFQPFGVPNVDDRRRLPSYARDATSEVVSMYETASQKAASRVFDEPDYRSYSMTQTTYSAYTLSNHRSYASLRSQQDGNGLLQRPISPFAYPARLKRPGFRPSSPALTDGGVIDYSRRAEIDRGTYQKSHNTSSPSSFYTQKRRPPLSLRQEANRSTPSLLSQTSPPRRSPSPGLRQSDGIIAHDWARRNGSTSGNTSPARSTFSFASTVNLYATASGTSNSTTPGKLAPSSPLYYDYTEDFEVDGYNRAAESLGSPPHFSIDKTIPEERPLSAERPPSTEPRVCQLISALRPPSSPTPMPTTPKPLEGAQNHRATTPTEERVEAAQPSVEERSSSVSQFEDLTDNKSAIRLSGLGYGAQELSTHDEGAFSLRPMNSYEASVSQSESEEASSGSMNDGALEGQPIKNPETQFSAELSQRVDHPPHVSSLPSSGRLLIDATTTPEAGWSINNLSQVRTFPIPVQRPRATPLPLSPKSGRIGLPEEAGAAPALSSSQGRLRSSSSFESVDTGFTELTNLIKSLEGSNRAKNHEKTQHILTTPQKSPHLVQAFPGGPMLRHTNINPSQTPPISSFNRSNSKQHHANTQVQSPERIHPYNGGRSIESSILASYAGFETSNCSHQVAIRPIPRSGSPMLAPKPISPARQLKLKNSVPQLMKALPELPPQRLADTISPANISRTPEDAMPCLFSSVLPELGATLVQETGHEIEKAMSWSEPPVSPTEGVLRAHKEEDSSKTTSTEQQPAADWSTIPDPPPRLKLKMRSFATLRPLSPLSSIPLETENRSPSSTSDPQPHVPGLTNSEKPANPKPPKFRLKITRASGSTSGTVRVNRESGESKAGTGFQLRNHKDLFTSSSGIDSIFRQVSHHLHSRKASAASNTGSEFLGSRVPMLNLTSNLNPHDTSPNTDIVIPQPQSTKSPCPHEARSVFSDDSSNVQGHSSMRGRLSSLRARITVPYVNRIGSQSYDDLTWRDRTRRESTVPLADRSASNLHDSRKSTEARPLRRFAQKIQHHRLKEKVLEWLKEARLAIKSRMKSRSTTESGQVHTRT